MLLVGIQQYLSVWVMQVGSAVSPCDFLGVGHHCQCIWCNLPTACLLHREVPDFCSPDQEHLSALDARSHTKVTASRLLELAQAAESLESGRMRQSSTDGGGGSCGHRFQTIWCILHLLLLPYGS